MKNILRFFITKRVRKYQGAKVRRCQGAKVRGDALMLSLLFSVFLLLVGVGLSRFLAQDLFFVRNILFSEKAYFAAESGLEEALIRLKTDPLDNIPGETVAIGPSMSAVVDAQNLLPEVAFSLPVNTTKRLRLKRDNPSNPLLMDWSLDVTGDGRLLWRLICQKNDSTGNSLGTVSAQNTLEGDKSIPSFKLETARIDDLQLSVLGGVEDVALRGKSVNEFLTTTLTTDAERESCYYNLQNVGGNPLQVVLKNADGIAPGEVLVKSEGLAGKKKKLIQYVYGQKVLTSFFDFGILYSE